MSELSELEEIEILFNVHALQFAVEHSTKGEYKALCLINGTPHKAFWSSDNDEIAKDIIHPLRRIYTGNPDKLKQAHLELEKMTNARKT